MTTTVSVNSDEEVIDRFYQALHAGDVPALLATLADDFVAHVSDGLPGGYGGFYTGGEQMLRECWVPVHQRFKALPHPSGHRIADPGHAVVTGDYHGTAPGTDEPFVAAFVHIFRVAEGQIVELRQITDTRRWPAASSHAPVAKAVFDAVRARDLPALLRAYSDDIVIRDDPALSYGGVFQGRDGAIEHSAGFATTWDVYQDGDERDPCEVLIDAGPDVLALWRLRASRGQHHLDQATVSRLTVAHGEVVTLEMFHADTSELRAFLDAHASETRLGPG